MKKILSLITIIITMLLLTACSNNDSTQILTTSYVGYDFTKAIVKDNLSVGLMTPINQDFHNYEPTSKDLLKLKKSEVFIFTGFEYDTWLINDETLNNYVGKNALTIKLENFNHSHDEEHEIEHHEEETEHYEEDHIHGEHFWTNPETAVVMLDHLAEILIDKYPEFKDEFLSNVNSYISSIKNASDEFLTFLGNYPNTELFYVGHMALQGFANRFNISIKALEETVNPGTDVTSNEINNFVKILKEKEVEYLFVEEVKSHHTANTINSLLGNKLVILELHGYHSVSNKDFSENVTYSDLLNRNIKNIKEALLNE